MRTAISTLCVPLICFVFTVRHQSRFLVDQKVIMSFLAGKDIFAILPTGYGKSLCYAPLPLLFDRLYRLQGECCSCLLKRNFHTDRACFLATGLPVQLLKKKKQPFVSTTFIPLVEFLFTIILHRCGTSIYTHSFYFCHLITLSLKEKNRYIQQHFKTMASHC